MFNVIMTAVLCLVYLLGVSASADAGCTAGCGASCANCDGSCGACAAIVKIKAKTVLVPGRRYVTKCEGNMCRRVPVPVAPQAAAPAAPPAAPSSCSSCSSGACGRSGFFRRLFGRR